MKRQDMTALVTEVYAAQQQIFKTKSIEYTRAAADPLANFKRIAEIVGVSPAKVCLIYLEKHLDAIRYAATADNPVKSEPLFGRLVDACTYLTLLYAIVNEEAGGWSDGIPV